MINRKRTQRVYRELGLAVRRRRGRRSSRPQRRMPAGPSTSSTTNSRTGGGCAGSTSSTTRRSAAWPRSWTPRSPAGASCASSKLSSLGTAGRISWSATTAPSSPRTPSSPGAPRPGSPGTTSPRGKPMQNGICEAFNGRMRDELLNETLFRSPRSRAGLRRRRGRGLQHRAPALGARLSLTGGVCRHPHRNGRSAAQPRPAPPSARCSPRRENRQTHAAALLSAG